MAKWLGQFLFICRHSLWISFHPITSALIEMNILYLFSTSLGWGHCVTLWNFFCRTVLKQSKVYDSQAGLSWSVLGIAGSVIGIQDKIGKLWNIHLTFKSLEQVISNLGCRASPCNRHHILYWQKTSMESVQEFPSLPHSTNSHNPTGTEDNKLTSETV